MSVKLMSAAFDAALPEVKVDGTNVSPSTMKIVLLALSDHASDDGKSIYPSLARLARMTGLTERSVQRAERALQELGILVKIGTSEYGTNEYRIIPSALSRYQAAQGVNLIHPNHQLNHQLNLI